MPPRNGGGKFGGATETTVAVVGVVVQQFSSHLG